ncbi:DNA binding domain-containing protein, excisionase family [Spirosomataceae bacterium TFI 002]|nr:DNA binding domain-containing protein, excisionase family [Spirosomataceae bacterium TFI 002]
MNTSIVIAITVEELKSLIQEAVSNSRNEPKVKEKKLLSIEEAAVFLGIPQNTIYQFTSKRTIPFIKLGRRLVFDKEELLEWVKQNRKSTKKEIENEN